ncbi:MAG: sensor histidine kinase [Vallitaleaceae bacterium]|nr:sensor histidine kinase [Vallitaleaceae bacterium]
MKLQYKIMGFFSIVIILLIGGISILIFRHLTTSLETQMGNNAMDMAVTVAAIDDIQSALAEQKPYSVVQNYIESFRSKTRFQYIIVMDMKGIQYSYPYNAGIGKRYRNGGESKVLSNGASYVSADRNVLISAIRAFAPIYYDGKQVGAVLVGLLTDQVNKENATNRQNIEYILSISMVIGLIGAVVLSYNIKESIYGLEPKEIALLLSQRELILESMDRGIIALDLNGKIILYNGTAQLTFNLPDDASGQLLKDYHHNFSAAMMKGLSEDVQESNKEIRISPVKTLLTSCCLMKDRKKGVIGIVASFEDLTEAKKMAEELTGYRSVVNALRAQNHEFMNKLHTISGLIQLEEFDKAIDYIEQVSADRAVISGTIMNKIKNTHVAAILLGKYHKLKEEKISLIIDQNSQLSGQFSLIKEDELCSLIGNLVDNAEDALIGQDGGKIEVFIKEHENGIHLIVQDNGKGIPKNIVDKIFESGITSKSKGRGLGLFIVKEIIDHYQGTIDLVNENGVKWDIFLPNNG